MAEGDEAQLRSEYRSEIDRMLRRRLRLTVVLYLILVGAACLFETRYHPERTWAVTVSYVAQVIACVLALAVAHLPRAPLGVEAVSAALGAVLSVLMTTYNVYSGSALERTASAQVCLLSGLFVLMPWGWRAQLFVSLAALGGVAAFGIERGLSEDVSYALLVVVTGGMTSVAGVFYLDRYRYDGFVRTALLARTKRQAEEEAEIAAALLVVGEALTTHLNEPDMLERVTRVAVETVGCDWGGTFVWDERRRAYRLRAGFGIRPAIFEEIAQVEFTTDSMPIVGLYRPGTLIEIANGADQVLVPPSLLARWEVASELCAPIPRRDDVVGLLCLGHRERTGPFSERERRLALGIAHAIAIALENARLIADLRAANQLKSEFVSTMSHELRTPLNVILGFAEMARDPALPPGEWRHCVDRIDHAGRDLLGLVEETLEIGRIEAGRDEVAIAVVDLPGLWRELGAGCAELPRGSTVALEWEHAVPDVVVQTDPRKLAVVVRNLVGNALKFTPEGRVRVQASIADDELALEIADTGIGIRPEDRESIFEMFRQGDGSDSRRFGGTGLGLYIARRFVEQLGGRIDLDSVPGRGSVFTVHLPATVDAAAR